MTAEPMKLLIRWTAVAAIVLMQGMGSALAEQPPKAAEEMKAAWAAVFEGHINDGLTRAAKLLSQIDPVQDEEAYWRASATLVEMLQDLENDNLADKILGIMGQKKIAESQQSRRAMMQYYLGYDLVRLGHRDAGEQILRALTVDNERQVFVNPQRLAAIFMSKIEFDRGNIDQSTIWMRRAVIGILISNNATPVEILDVLAEYAAHLTLTRRSLDALVLYARLEPIYKTSIPKHSLKYLRFTAQLLQTLTTVGAYPEADRVLADLKEAVKGVDVLPPTIMMTLLNQELYQAARAAPENGQNPVVERMKKLATENPDLLKNPEFRIAFSYFALLAGNYQLADQYARPSQTDQSENPQIRAYDVLLQSLSAASQKDFSKSLHLAREGMDDFHLFLHGFESVSSNWSPTLRSEERLVLSAILAVNAEKAASAEDRDTLFDIAQLLNSDKSKLGLAARISRQGLKLDLLREDLRTRDRLRDIRDRLMDDAVRMLITRVVTPKKDQSNPQKVDASALIRLEEIEDKIVIADQETRDAYRKPEEFLSNIDPLQKVIRQNEALIVHNVTPFGIVQICITNDAAQFHFEFTRTTAKQLIIDEKLVLAAVHAEHPPSPTLDESFPSENAYRLYTFLFGGIEACINNKPHLLLATDPNLFAFPFNALLTSPGAPGQPFSNRAAAWLPKLYAISLLPSVNAIYQLRTSSQPSQAQQKYLGIGDPNLQGPREPAPQISLRSLYVERGVTNVEAVRGLPPLPESADELKAVSAALGAPKDSVLLGPNATERALRSRPLNDYRVISFATHALVAGDVEGVSEPAIVLTPGTEGNPANDGLLTATEIANFDLDANLVILSACNTAAGDGAANGRGLSGLANAFFFAGARSIAVTQWAVLSQVAQAFGAGLISRSSGPQGVGVAEALRRTMTDYISTVSDDYLAHPRFWAAFAIAGDGAIRPLDGQSPATPDSNAVAVKSEQLMPDEAQSEFAGIAKIPATGAIYAVGRLKPPPGTRFSGSYLARLHPTGRAEVISAEPTTAAGPISAMRNGMVLLGSIYSEEKKSGALFRFMDNDGKEVWRFAEDGPLQDVPVGAIDVPQGYILASTTEDWSGSSSPSPSKLVINLVSAAGEPILRREYVVSDGPLSSIPPGLIVKGGTNNLIVAVNKVHTPAEEKQPGWVINPLTGSHRFCQGGNMVTFIDIDAETLEMRSIEYTHYRIARAIKLHDGTIFVGFSTSHDCRLEHGIELAKLDPELKPQTVFKYEGVNDIQLWDFAPLEGTFVLAGSVRVQLPATLLREVIPREQLISANPLDPPFWERGEEPPNAFIFVANADGTVLGDRVFPDLLNRNISRVVVARESKAIVGVGAALGDRGWAVVLEPRASVADQPRATGAQH